MIHLRGTDVWRKTYRVRNDARFAYKLSPNDSLQSFADVKGEEQMQTRLAMLQVDPLNPVIGVILVEATGDTKGEWLSEQVSASPRLPLRFYLEVGLMEDYRVQIEPNRRVEETLRQRVIRSATPNTMVAIPF